MAARELTPESPEQTEAMFPKLDDGQIARLASLSERNLTHVDCYRERPWNFVQRHPEGFGLTIRAH
jgi:superfamily I DNA and RNA helicase